MYCGVCVLSSKYIRDHALLSVKVGFRGGPVFYIICKGNVVKYIYNIYLRYFFGTIFT